MDKVMTKNSFPNDILKNYARTKAINCECPLYTGVIIAARRNELSVRASDLKCKVRKDKKITYNV